MKLHPFASVRSNPYYEKAPTEAQDSLPELNHPITAKTEYSHAYTTQPALYQTTKSICERNWKLRTFVAWSEWTQLGVRVALLIGAVGLLVCTFSFRDLQNEQSYTLRIPPCIDVLTSAYSIYRLLARSKNPRLSSAASYHFIALIIDAGLIPFYVFIALLARGSPAAQAVLEGPDAGAWTSMFHGTESTQEVIFATWLVAIILVAIHTLAFGLSCALFFSFCRLSRAEATQALLESHLTARPSRHNYNKSDELYGNARVHVLPMEKPHPISFLQTRSDGDTRYSPHNPKTVVSATRLNLDLPALPTGAHSSHPGSPSKSTIYFTSHAGSSMQSFSGSSFYSGIEGVPPLPRKSSKRRSEIPSEAYFAGSELGSPRTLGDANSHLNVVMVEEDYDSSRQSSHSPVLRAASSVSAFDFAMPTTYRGAAYRSLPQDSPEGSSEHLISSSEIPQVDTRQSFNASHMRPLHMNPLTPPDDSEPVQPLGDRSPNSVPVKLPKSRFYGDLGLGLDIGTLGADSASIRSVPKEDQNGRVVSRSGVDIADAGLQNRMDASDDDDGDSTHYHGARGVVGSGLRGRVVSGKIAEEGRVAKGGDEVLQADEQMPSGRVNWGSGRWFKRREVH